MPDLDLLMQALGFDTVHYQPFLFKTSMDPMYICRSNDFLSLVAFGKLPTKRGVVHTCYIDQGRS